MGVRTDLNNFFAGTFDMADRIESVHGAINMAGKILEISPNWAPLVVAEDLLPSGQIHYCDRMPYPWIRDREKSNLDRIKAGLEVMQTDFTWTPGKKLTECTNQTYDFVVSSHVVEHVPDLLGHMIEISDVLTEKGKYVIVLPNADGTGEFFRRKSNDADVVEHFFRGGWSTSPGQNWDYLMNIFKYKETAIRDRSFSEFERHHTDAEAIQDAFRCLTEYVDVHCWVFSPRTFLELVERLHDLRLFPFRVAGLYESNKRTMDGDCFEFVVELQKVPFEIPIEWGRYVAARPSSKWFRRKKESFNLGVVQIWKRALSLIKG